MGIMRRRSHLSPYLSGLLTAVLLSGCAPTLQVHGNELDPELLAEIRAGESSRDDVIDLLGSPSSVAMFDGESWFYVSERTEKTAFFSPEIKERKVVVFRFDEDGVVSDIDSRGLDSARAIQPVDRETPTAGNEVTILEQLIGNFGRYNTDDDE